MSEDWAIDVRKYVPDAEGDIIAGIVRYCGISLRNRESSLVSFTEPAETDRVKANFLRKKLGLTDPDSVLDSAIAAVGERMKADTTRNRVTVYYLLASHFGRLEDFRPKNKGGKAVDEELPLAAAAIPVAPPPPPPPPLPPVQPVMAAVPPVAPVRRSAPPAIGLGGLWPIAAALLVFGGVGALIVGGSGKRAAAPMAVAAVAPAVLPPAGAGVTEQVIDGRPQVSIYFDTAKSDIYPNFEARTEWLRKWLAENPGHHLEISGFNDPRGDAAFNAALSKSRAYAVRGGLVALGVAATDIDLVKPADTNDRIDSLAQARRVDVTIVDGPVPEGEAATEPTPP